MRDRITLWGENAENEKIFLALELLIDSNKVRIFIFKEKAITEGFVEAMEKKWRFGEEIDLIEDRITIESDLTMTGHLLPETIRANRPDLITRAQTEWHFSVLSSKLSKVYRDELEVLKKNIEDLKEYNSDHWIKLKSFWSKVEDQIRDNNLVNNHARDLRIETNELFNKLKDLRKKIDNQFKEKSKETATQFNNLIQEVEKKIENDSVLRPLFDELKKIQTQFKSHSFTKEDRNQVWSKLDRAFKSIKQKRFGSDGERRNSALSRVQSRFEGLLGAIARIENSINRDKSDLAFQDRRINKTEGQLELQLRQAKKVMIEERVKSKQIRLDDMLKTKIELEKNIKKEQERESSRKEKAEIKKEKTNLHKEVKINIEKKKELDSKDPKIINAEKQIRESKGQRAKDAEKMANTLSNVVEDLFEDTIDTIRAITHLFSDSLSSTPTQSEEE